MSWISLETAQQLQVSGHHAELARQATALLQQALQTNAEILWDPTFDGGQGLWLRRVGPHYFPDPTLFSTSDPPFARWAAQPEKHLRDANDYWFHLYRAQPGDTIVDIGAGRGEDVFSFSRAVGVPGQVWAIEPHPQSFALLTAFCKWNGLDNVRCLQYACIDRPAELQIETLPVWESNYVRTGLPSAASYPVTGVTFDSLSEALQIGPIHFLKMNIEGAERLALPGCREALRRTEYVCISAHDFRANRGEGEAFRTLQFVRAFLNDAGFELTTRDADPRYYVPFHVHGRRR